MALAFFRKPAAAEAAGPTATHPATATATAASAMPGGDAAKDSAKDSAKDILNLLELELGAMIRQLERAAASVATGAQSTAATLSAIRQRTDTLTGHTSTAQETAATFSQAADKFSHSADGINGQVREAGKLADQASEAAREAGANVDRLRESSAAIGNVVNLIATIAKQTTLLALNSPSRRRAPARPGAASPSSHRR
jgi:methyl-accepting chemotaxis protein